MEVALDDNNVLEYVQGKVLEPLANTSTIIKSRYKRGDLKAKKIIINGLQDHFLIYVDILKNPKYIYDKVIRMYEVNNLNHILSMKNKLKEMKINNKESLQSYIMRVSHLRDKLQSVSEQISDKELVLVTLQGLPPILETLITSLRKNNFCPTFNEFVGK